MKVGDLVCFNGAGQKHKTLGVVIDFDHPRGVILGHVYSVLIQWCVVGSVMPRECYTLGRNNGRGDKIVSGQLIWHPVGDWFEVIS